MERVHDKHARKIYTHGCIEGGGIHNIKYYINFKGCMQMTLYYNLSTLGLRLHVHIVQSHQAE